MKVLFAVSNENISESILKKYQKEYKEIISYKNVYYFNAILKEIQKDKSYDRIVISEDLEPFANNNYDQIDKFLFEKLDSISDEATDEEGNDKTIILICTDRRTKADGILVKLFGLGVYNAIIGQDRSIDEVCRLINKPRNKKEAKQYYKIEVDDVNYQTENDSDVNEVEIQNILAHYKRLGKDEEKYVDSFNNIASQYTDAQLRVIAKFLPIQVKAVLEESSPKYQQVMAFGGGKKGSSVSSSPIREQKPDMKTKPKGAPAKIKNKPVDLTSLKIESLETKKPASGKPIVIPSAINPLDVKKLTQDQSQTSQLIMPEEEIEEQVRETPNILHEPVVEIEGFEDLETLEVPKQESREEIQEELIDTVPVKRGRGRPKKVEAAKVIPENLGELPVKKGRGRPKKIQPSQETENEQLVEESVNLFALEQNASDFEDQDDSAVNLFELSEESQTEENDARISPITKIQKEVTQSAHEFKSLSQENYTYSPSNTFISSDKKVISFVGTSKNGVSFLVNNIAYILAEVGIDTAILDLTENKNAYYIYTKNDESLRKTANESLQKLEEGVASGIVANRNLTVYTTLPGATSTPSATKKVIETLTQKHEVILIDTDYHTPLEYFASSNEIYLVQSMDILTIQPLTAFLRELKAKNILDESKLRVIINKELKVANLSAKTLIGGIAFYNEPSMSFMTELFNRNTIQYFTIPFDELAYIKYLEGIVTCEISTKGFSKNMLAKLKELTAAIYPMLNKQAYKMDYGKFSPNINDTLNQMKKKY